MHEAKAKMQRGIRTSTIACTTCTTTPALVLARITKSFSIPVPVNLGFVLEVLWKLNGEILGLLADLVLVFLPDVAIGPWLWRSPDPVDN